MVKLSHSKLSHPATDTCTVPAFQIMERASLHRIISLNCRKLNHWVREKVTELLPERNVSSGTKLDQSSLVSIKAG